VNSAFVRVKICRKKFLAKMMVDSGNLAQDLVSLEFAELIGAEYKPHQQKVGTAAKGGTVTIVSSIEVPLLDTVWLI